jgi:hypothetical protein
LRRKYCPVSTTSFQIHSTTCNLVTARISPHSTECFYWISPPHFYCTLMTCTSNHLTISIPSNHVPFILISAPFDYFSLRIWFKSAHSSSPNPTLYNLTWWIHLLLP